MSHKNTKAAPSSGRWHQIEKVFSLRLALLLLAATAMVTALSLSRYSTTAAGSGTLTVARPAVSLSLVETRLNGALYTAATPPQLGPSDTLTVTYQAANSEAGNVSQVSLSYTLTAGTDLATEPFNYAWDSTPAANPSAAYTFGHVAEPARTHILTITPKSGVTLPAGTTPTVKVTLNAVQVN